jgi:hypothetical protein
LFYAAVALEAVVLNDRVHLSERGQADAESQGEDERKGAGIGVTVYEGWGGSYRFRDDSR